MTATTLPVASPCIGVCRLDADARVCVGCGRTGEEIAGWRAADEATRRGVLASLAPRLSALDGTPARLPLAPADVPALVREALSGGGAVVAGCHGALAEFMAAPGETATIAETGGPSPALTARVAGGALRLRLPADLAVFATPEPADGGHAPLLLAAPSDGLALPVARGLARIGPDPAAIAAASAGRGAGILFDLGLGRPETRFMVRVGDSALAARLDDLAGAPPERVLAEAGPALVAASPVRVVETPLCRIEVDTPIPPPNGRPPVAPHTHLLPGPLALARLLPPGIARPAGFLPVALLYRPEAVR